jgi:hypothetical protein
LQFAGYYSSKRVMVTAKTVRVLEDLFLRGYNVTAWGDRIDVSEETTAYIFKGQ